MDIQKVKDYWLEEAEDALRVMQHLFEKGDYSYALFFGHLAVEKILKAVYVIRKGEHAPYLHDLEKLAKHSTIPLTSEQKRLLIQITNFNIEARYPDEKRSFRKKCTEDFTKEMLNKIEEVFQWLKSMI
ncbi:MAG TPA: DNA-binding protein [Nitrospiraceae bacterium]|nr:DNA-binding protein [Nitrospiraceae bacterium]